MKLAVVSYSMTGNNEALASRAARMLVAEHIRIAEPWPRKTGSIFADLIFRKTPRVQPSPDALDPYDLILYFRRSGSGRSRRRCAHTCST